MNLRNVAHLRALLFEMETAQELTALSPSERDVLYAIVEVAVGKQRVARSEAIRTHPLAASIPQATYHRALKVLLEKGMIDHAPNTRAGQYIARDASADQA